METAGVVVLSVLAGLLGVASAALGFVAESKRLTIHDISVSADNKECVYHATPAYGMGICAVLMLLAAQITASAAGGCCGCCCKPRDGAASEGKRLIGAILSVISWITAVIVAYFYLQGVYWNSSLTLRAHFTKGDVVDCIYLKGGMFTRGAVVALVTTAIGVMSCVFLRARAAPPPPPPTAAPVDGADDGPDKPDGVAIGLPQWPAQGYGQAPYQQHPGQV